MTKAWPRHFARLPLTGLLVWALVACAGAAWLAYERLQQLQAAFETDGRIVHRRLGQRVVQYEAVMSTLALLQPPAAPANSSPRAPGAALTRLPSVYPQILSVLQRTGDEPWPAALQGPLTAAEAVSRQSGRPEMALIDLPAGRYHLVMASTPASYALQIDLRATVPYDEWPMDTATSPVRVTLELGGAAFVVQPGRVDDGRFGWTYHFHKLLTVPSQPLDVVAQRTVGLRELPWLGMLAWCVATAALGLGGLGWWRQRASRQRAEQLLRLGQVARLNTLGELAAGMAHELNQPLTALLSSTQAAQRLLAEEPPELPTAQTAMARAVEQARRASTVVGRLRRLVERPDPAGQVQPLPLAPAVQDVLRLLEPELEQRGITPTLLADPDLPLVLAEPVALQQIIYNLLMNAAQAMEQVAPAERRLELRLGPHGTAQVALAVRDHGPGVPPEARAHLFEPFYTTRAGGLGLGLTLCESLAHAMGASLTLSGAATTTPEAGEGRSERGAEFVLVMPAATGALPASPAAPAAPPTA